MYFWCFGFRGELGFLNCDDVCMCVVNKQFELLEFVSESVYVDLQLWSPFLIKHITQLEKIQWSFTKHITGMNDMPYHERLKKGTALSIFGKLLRAIFQDIFQDYLG